MISSYAFNSCNDLETIISENAVPDSIELGADIFQYVDTTTCVLRVPKGSKSLYEVADQWKSFDIIEEGFDPVITSIPLDTVTAGNTFTYIVEAKDADGDTLSYSLSNAPDGMTITDSLITWTTSVGVATSGEVSLLVNDGDTAIVQKFTITVFNAPVITSTASTLAAVGTEYTYTVAATDANGEALTYTLSDSPSGMTISDNVITWTPTTGTTTSGEVTLTVSDGVLIATEKFTITVKNSPVITSTAPTIATVGTEYSYTVVATDANGDALTYTLSNAPEGMTISDNVISWTPTEGTITSGEISLSVSDGELTTTVIFTISVSGNTPVITSTAPTTANVGSEYSYTVVATDADSDALTYTLSNAPDGMSISENVITWTPVSGTTTSGEVTLTVSDGSLSDTEQFTITVTENSSSAINDITSAGIMVFPNPVQSILNIKSETVIESIQLISIMGAIVISEETNSSELQINIESVPSGTYFLKTNTSNGSVIKQIIKQ